MAQATRSLRPTGDPGPWFRRLTMGSGTPLGALFQTFWRLLPANPILVRVVSGASRRIRHLWVRAGYLALLLFVLLVAWAFYAAEGGPAQTLSDMAKLSSKVFTAISVVQLALICLVAPIFTAGAITQERDAQTFNILLTTPLTNAQIVLGSLLSRLYFVLVLLLSGLPIFCVTLLYGGVTVRSIFLSFGISACTAILTGSLAIAISVIRIGTRRTIFSFYFAIGLYLLAVFALGSLPQTQIGAARPGSLISTTSWLAPFHPFLSLFVALNISPLPGPADVADFPPWAQASLIHPERAYMTLTVIVSLVLVAGCTLFVRRTSIREGEAKVWAKLLARLTGIRGGDRRRPRHVWNNPIAWREAATRAAASGQGTIRWAFVAGGLAAGLLLLWLYSAGAYGLTAAATTRDWLMGLILVEFVTVLLLATNAAASAITRERDTNTMELLLTTPLTSAAIVWGKLRGLVSFTIPLIAVPSATVAAFALFDFVSAVPTPVVYPEAAFIVPVLMLVYTSFACMLGLQTSLKSRRTIQALLTSTSILVIAGFGLYLCGYVFVSAGVPQISAFCSPLLMVYALVAAIDPNTVIGSAINQGANSARIVAANVRIPMFAGSLFSVAVYVLAVWAMYRWMVRHFDETVRKQSQ